jgi:Zn-dependent protease
MIDDFLRDPAGAIQVLLLMIPGLLMAVTIHEVAHGWVAERLGDPTARLAGPLTLDPRPHIDPLGAWRSCWRLRMARPYGQCSESPAYRA